MHRDSDLVQEITADVHGEREYRRAIAQAQKQAKAEIETARGLAKECEERFGVKLDVRELAD